MATDFRIACIDCHEYLELHKWYPDDELNSEYPCNLKIGKYCGSKTEKSKVDLAIRNINVEVLKENPDHWINSLIPFLNDFIIKHEHHNLIIYNDCSEMPWYPDEDFWYKWKEIEGPMSCWDREFTDVDLPRNIIDDLGIRSWEKAKRHYQDNCASITSESTIKSLESIFNYYLSN